MLQLTRSLLPLSSEGKKLQNSHILYFDILSMILPLKGSYREKRARERKSEWCHVQNKEMKEVFLKWKDVNGEEVIANG